MMMRNPSSDTIRRFVVVYVVGVITALLLLHYDCDTYFGTSSSSRNACFLSFNNNINNTATKKILTTDCISFRSHSSNNHAVILNHRNNGNHEQMDDDGQHDSNDKHMNSYEERRLHHSSIIKTGPSSSSSTSGQFNMQIMERIQERLRDFMQFPVDISESLHNYYVKKGFPSGNMMASERDKVLQYLYPLNTPPIDLLLYVGLEDGTLMFYWDIYVGIEYREPGNSGYLVDNIQPSDPYYKHYISCVDYATGDNANCTLHVGMLYVECIDDCQLIPCSEYNNETGTESSSSVNTTGNNWCYNYQVKTVLENETNVYGYVPNTDFCLNKLGLPEQTNGNVLLDYESNILGNCYYLDGTTIVNRTLSGPYSACGNKYDMTGHIVSGDPIVCDTTFIGGFKSGPYDPRFRPWYQLSKQAQQPVWTNSYAYYSYNGIGITYTHPMYIPYNNGTNNDTNNNNDNNSDMVFHGVIAIDYKVESIQKFLNLQFPDLEQTKIVIVEEIEPHFVLATNTGGPYTKFVDKTNSSLPCRPNRTLIQSNCDVERISITDIQTSLDDNETVFFNASAFTSVDNVTRVASNQVLKKAFEVFQAAGFPDDKMIDFKVNDDVIGSPAYVAQCEYYQNTNSAPDSRWHVFVILPMPRSTTDAVTRSTNPLAFTLTCLLGTFGVVSCFIQFMVLCRRRHERAVQQCDYTFTCIFILGCSAFNLSTFTLLGDNTKVTCMLRMWSFHFLFVAAISPLFVKAWRMFSIRSASSGFQRVRISHLQALLYTLPLCIIEIVILLIFTMVDPSKPKETIGVGNDNGSIGVQQIVCAHNSVAFFATQFTYGAGLLLVGCILAYSSRDLDPKYGEAKQLCFSMYNIAVTGILVVSTIKLVDLDQATATVLMAVGILWGSFFSSFSFVLPSILQVERDKKSLLGSGTSSHSSKKLDNVDTSGDDGKSFATNHDGSSRHLDSLEKKTLLRITEVKEEINDETNFHEAIQNFVENTDKRLHQIPDEEEELDVIARIDRDSSISIYFESEHTPEELPNLGLENNESNTIRHVSETE